MIRKQNDIVGSLFQDIAHLIRLRIDKELKPHGLTRLKWLAIGIVQSDPGLTQTDLSRRLELKAAATGRLVDRLAGRGLVKRQADPEDRRAHRLFITEKAQRLLTELEPMGEFIRKEVLKDLKADERVALGHMMSKIKKRLTATSIVLLAALFTPLIAAWTECATTL